MAARARRTLGRRDLIRTGPGGCAFAADDGVWVDIDEFAAPARAGLTHLGQGRVGEAATLLERAQPVGRAARRGRR